MLRPAWRLMGVWLFLLIVGFAGAKGPGQVQVTGGSTQNGIFEPFYFTWHYQMPVNGSGWTSGDHIHILLHGPINTPGITPTDREIGDFFTDGSGSFNTSVQIPYDEGGPYTIPQPGRYKVLANDDSANVRFADDQINLAPATATADPVGINWSKERGGRDGGVDGILRVFPEWISIWSEKPVELYGTFQEIDNNSADEPSVITSSDWPFAHYAHDADLVVAPDPQYRWLLGTANFFVADGEPPREVRHMAVEWETQNLGSGDGMQTGQGPIGLPLFAMPTANDRLYVVGRWIMDNGHPDSGDLAELHPPRLFAVIRNNPTVMPLRPGSSCMTYAKQVDVMVSGHGGGANQYYYSLSNVLGSGGRVSDILSGEELDDYYANEIGFSNGLDLEPFNSAGDYSRMPEFNPINDMDYDFDVPLPTPPAGALVPQVEVTSQPMDTTSVTEVITYGNYVNGLPTTAHVHLPCNGGDNGTYARRLKFSWDKYKVPAHHFQVQITDIQVTDNAEFAGDGEFFMWGEACGQWINLSQLNPDGFYDTGGSDDIGGLGAANFDVYLDPGQSMHVMAEGYERNHLDHDFGQGFGNGPTEDAAELAIAYLDPTDSGDNTDLGNGLIRIDNATKDNAVGHFESASVNHDGKSYFKTRTTVSYVPAPPRIELNGVPADFSHVCLNDFHDQVIEIFNVGEAGLDVNSITVTGGGFSRLTSPNVPFTVAGGDHVDITVRFNPNDVSQGTGQIRFDTSDPCQAHLAFPLSGVVDYPNATLSGSLSYGLVPVDDRSIGSSVTRTFHVNNTGACPLILSGATVATGGANFALGTLPTFPQTIQPGGSLSVPVVFNPASMGPASGSVNVTLSNDPTKASATINMDGTGIVPYAVSTPTDTHFQPTVVGFSRTQTITLANNGPAELIVDNIQMNGSDYSVTPVNLPVRLAPNSSTNFTVTFAPHSVMRRSNGSLVFTTNDPVHSTVTDTFCGEGLNTGFRVLVLQANGTPYPSVDQINLASFGVKPSTSLFLKNASLVTVNPPTSCDVIQYQMEKMPLPATNQANKKGSYYTLKVKVGAKSQGVSFTLAPSDFLQIVIKLQ